MRRASLPFLLVACSSSSSGEWKERAGPGFTVTAPFEARHFTKAITDGVVMDIYEYADGSVLSLQVDVARIPEDRGANSGIVRMRDDFATKATISREEDVFISGLLRDRHASGREAGARGGR